MIVCSKVVAISTLCGLSISISKLVHFDKVKHEHEQSDMKFLCVVCHSDSAIPRCWYAVRSAPNHMEQKGRLTTQQILYCCQQCVDGARGSAVPACRLGFVPCGLGWCINQLSYLQLEQHLLKVSEGLRDAAAAFLDSLEGRIGLFCLHESDLMYQLQEQLLLIDSISWPCFRSTGKPALPNGISFKLQLGEVLELPVSVHATQHTYGAYYAQRPSQCTRRCADVSRLRLACVAVPMYKLPTIPIIFVC